MTHICAECGKKFEADPRRNRIYCSTECFNAHKRLPILIKNCEYCGLEFKTKRERQRFCSRNCSIKSRSVKVGNKVGNKSANTNTCATCKYCKRAQGYSSDHCAGYRCYECTNVGSMYYRAFLNIDRNGINMRSITWPGCDKWTGKKVVV